MSISRRGFLSGLGATALACGSTEAGQHTEHSTFPIPDGRMGLLHDSTYCVGCRACEVACNRVNELPPPDQPIGDLSVFDRERRTTDTALTVVNRYRVDDVDVFRKHQCMHCNEPSCASVCLVRALVKSPEGPVLYDPDVCVGCRYCMMTCPYYALAYEYESPNPRVVRCTMCYPRIVEGQVPGCAEACPMGAITYGRRSDLLHQARERIAEHPGRYVEHVFGEHEFGGTSWLLLAGTSPSRLGLASLENASHTPLPELTKSFLSVVPLVLTLWPGLLLGFYAMTKRREEVSEAEARARVVEALLSADEETKTKLAAAAARSEKDKEKAIAQAVKKALEEQAAKGGAS
ncbi:MAG: 4Fe-4S dicluster domain-containing protein [Thermoanaerobaculales bacterium]|jgi:Fe-S-cluster-containing dehydrogenase component|nr:4Fe-4S dicluster domain-containing protein [Thermoanaerobaculales bacterium]